MEDLVLNEVKELVETFQGYVNKPLLIKDSFFRPVVNGLWVLTAATRFPQENTKPIQLLIDYFT